MTQRLTPNTDLDTTGWTKNGGTWFFQQVDEDPTANDSFTTYVRTSTNLATLKLLLSDGDKPAEFAGWFLRVAWRVESPESISYVLRVSLYEEDTLIGTLTDTLTGPLQEHEFETTITYELPPDAVGEITGMNNLIMWISCEAEFSGPDDCFVTAADLLIPNGQIIVPIVHGYI